MNSKFGFGIFLGTTVTVLIIIVILYIMDGTQKSIKNSCDNFGTFRIDKQEYYCQEKR